MLIIQVRVAQGKMTLDWSTEESYVLVISSAGTAFVLVISA